MAFKMKGSPMQRNYGISPVKSIIGDVVASVGSQLRGIRKDVKKTTKKIFGKENIEARRNKQIEKNKGGEYEGMTNFERRQADRKAQREGGGKSKYQRDIIKKRADRNPAKIETEKVGLPPASLDTKIDNNFTKNVLSPTIGADRIDKTLDPKRTKSRLFDPSKTYKAGEADPDDAWNHNKLTEDKSKIYNSRTHTWDDYTGELLSALKKKSPTKKSGFKMKNSPAKNYKKGYYGA